MIQVFWIHAIVGHTGPTVINDEGMGYPLDDDDLCFISCIAHNTHTQHLESIAVRGLLPRGGGVTIALRAQFLFFVQLIQADFGSPVAFEALMRS